MRISVDQGVCIGAGQCVLTAPQVFTQDDDGFSEVLAGREDGHGSPLVREAARACPVSAITVREDGTGGEEGEAAGGPVH
ncbi:ferredoxin [Streptomyces sp. NPDC048352]|uniref:ferredoxin n=1 Tax=Streptomyces sp. NPDC048352 TaxID=3154718 RepID=UPI003436FAFF